MSLFARFRKKHGAGIDCKFMPEETLEDYRSKLPRGVAELWREFGLCGYSQGLIWMTDPAELEDVLDLWFEDSDRYVCFGRTAFADLFLWDGDAILYLDCQTAQLTNLGPRAIVFFEASLCSDEFLDLVAGRGLHQEAIQKLGVVQRDECYAFEPILALGGSGSIDSVARVKLREHLALLAEVLRPETP